MTNDIRFKSSSGEFNVPLTLKPDENAKAQDSKFCKTTAKNSDFKALIISVEKKVLSKWVNFVGRLNLSRSKKGLFLLHNNPFEANLFQTFYELCRRVRVNQGCDNADKFTRLILKIGIKTSLLSQNGYFKEPTDRNVIEQYRQNVKTIALTLVSFSDVAYTFDENYLAKLIAWNKRLLLKLVTEHLTPKSISKIESIYATLTDHAFLRAAFLDDPITKSCDVGPQGAIRENNRNESYIDKTAIHNIERLHLEEREEELNINPTTIYRLPKFSRSIETTNFIEAIRNINFE